MKYLVNRKQFLGAVSEYNLTQTENLFVDFIGKFFFIFVSAFLTAAFVMWLWNVCLVGAVDGVHTIGFWKAYGIAVLCSLLFKSNIVNGSK